VDGRLPPSLLYGDLIGVGDVDRLVSVEFELTVNYLFGAPVLCRVLYLIGLQETLGNLLKVPSDDERASGCYNACFFQVGVVELIESGGREVDSPYFIFGQIFHLNLKLPRLWLVLAHLVVKSILIFAKAGWDQQEVGLRGGYDPLGIHAHVNGTDGIT